ncbi:MAG: D-tyrosyl-tRNA(Tyr) deacylase [Myxococcales bacterium]|nr:D-tyrosyl-tRNA(Tyr) deacylase [Myxococcales bacterium]
MRAVVQRVLEAGVAVEGEVVGAIGRGLLVYLGAADGDDANDVEYVVQKIAGLRIFPDDRGRMSLGPAEVSAEILVVSQFTLFGDLRRGRRPSFDGAAAPERAEALYLEVVARLRALGFRVATGRFRADMRVSSVGDGPVTILLDSRKLF